MIPKCPHCQVELDLPEGDDEDVITCGGCDRDFTRFEAFSEDLEDLADQFKEHKEKLKNDEILENFTADLIDDISKKAPKDSPPEPPPVIQKPESKTSIQQNESTAKLKSWTGNTAGLSLLSLFIPVAGLFLSIPFWISSFILCIICLAKGEYRTGVGAMVFLMFLMPIAWFVALGMQSGQL